MDIIQQKIKSDIKNPDYGFAVMGVFADPDAMTPPFCYTVGLKDTLDHPEIIVMGVRQEIGHYLIHKAVDEIKSGRKFTDGSSSLNVGRFPVVFKKLTTKQVDDWAVQGLEYYYNKGESAPVYLQMVLTDDKGKFPWDEDFNEKLMGKAQPLLWLM
jgi:hypothetical protein